VRRRRSATDTHFATMAATIHPDLCENDFCRELTDRVNNYLFYVASTP
jgi:hypothetical protein